MTGFGTHNQPPGTWSDDTSLSLCLMESLCDGFTLSDQADRFRRWLFQAHWTPHGSVFDVGQTTREAIFRLDRVVDPRDAGPTDQYTNGNGSRMRILPIAIYFAHDNPMDRLARTMDASRLTHGHIRSQLACGFLVELAAQLIHGRTFTEALSSARSTLAPVIEQRYEQESPAFTRLFDVGLVNRAANEISGSGYVIHSLEAAVWCTARAESFADAVLAAVNLGEDTDTTAAISGGLAGLRFGRLSIPSHWISKLARVDEIDSLIVRFAEACVRQWSRAKT